MGEAGRTTSRVWSSPIALLWLADRLLSVCLLQDKKCLLLLSLFRNETFSIEVVLYSRQRTAWRAKVHEDPRRHSPQLRNAIEHDELMLVDVGLIFLRPAFVLRAVQTVFGVSPE